jgi:hypothetical protein
MEVILSNRKLKDWFALLPTLHHDGSSTTPTATTTTTAAAATTAPGGAFSTAATTGRELMHVGRLDKRTTGLLLVTDDGDLCSLICTPKTCVKVYHVHSSFHFLVSFANTRFFKDIRGRWVCFRWHVLLA